MSDAAFKLEKQDELDLRWFFRMGPRPKKLTEKQQRRYRSIQRRLDGRGGRLRAYLENAESIDRFRDPRLAAIFPWELYQSPRVPGDEPPPVEAKELEQMEGQVAYGEAAPYLLHYALRYADLALAAEYASFREAEPSPHVVLTERELLAALGFEAQHKLASDVRNGLIEPGTWVKTWRVSRRGARLIVGLEETSPFDVLRERAKSGLTWQKEWADLVREREKEARGDEPEEDEPEQAEQKRRLTPEERRNERRAERAEDREARRAALEAHPRRRFEGSPMAAMAGELHGSGHAMPVDRPLAEPEREVGKATTTVRELERKLGIGANTVRRLLVEHGCEAAKVKNTPIPLAWLKTDGGRRFWAAAGRAQGRRRSR